MGGAAHADANALWEVSGTSSAKAAESFKVPERDVTAHLDAWHLLADAAS